MNFGSEEEEEDGEWEKWRFLSLAERVKKRSNIELRRLLRLVLVEIAKIVFEEILFYFFRILSLVKKITD